MKKIVSLLAIACGLVLASCTHKVEDFFSEDSATRMDEQQKKCLELLTSSPNGWIVEYFPSQELHYGGCTYIMNFDNDNYVTITGDVSVKMGLAAPGQERSHFSIKRSSGVVLAFDSYNSSLHSCSDPDLNKGKIYDGDYEWVFIDGDSERMEFHSIKTRHRVIFTKFPETENKFDYVNRIIDMRNEVIPYLYAGFKWDTGDGNPIELIDQAETHLAVLSYFPNPETEPDVYTTYSFRYTADGLVFYDPVTFKGVTAQTFKFENGSFVAQDAVNASGAPAEVSMTGFHPEGFIHYDEFLGKYKFYYGSSGQNSANVEIIKNENFLSYYMLLDGTNYKFPLTYNKASASMSLTESVVETRIIDGVEHTLKCLPWDNIHNGSYSWNTKGPGMNLLVDKSVSDKFTIIFEDNGKWTDKTCTGWIIGIFNGSTRVSNDSNKWSYWKRLEKISE